MARSPKTANTSASEPVEAQTEMEIGDDAANRTPRAGSKLAMVTGLLEGETGATIAEIMAATGWQQHTVRGALSGAIAKRFGRSLASDKVEGRGRVYRNGGKAD